MTDEWLKRLEVVYMSTQGAQVIDLDEYRRRREAQSRERASTVFLSPVVWVPVWMWVPYWPAR
jgi:hypothetical protein